MNIIAAKLPPQEVGRGTEGRSRCVCHTLVMVATVDRDRCPHGKSNNGYLCKSCPGKGICRTSQKPKHYCDCGGIGCGMSLCKPHKKKRFTCRVCKGSQICEHGRDKYDCWEGGQFCLGTSRCKHGNQRSSRCEKCDSEAQLCEEIQLLEEATPPPQSKLGRSAFPRGAWGVTHPMGPLRQVAAIGAAALPSLLS